MAQGLISFSFLLLCACLVAAVTKQEVYDSLQTIGNEIRRDESLALQNAIRDASLNATPAQRACIHRQSALARGHLNAALGMELVALRKEYGTRTEAQFEQTTLEAENKYIRERLSAAVASSGSNANQVLGCV